MQIRLSTTPLIGIIGALFSLTSFAQYLPTSAAGVTPMPWTISATASEAAVGHGLPVLALDRDDWPNYRSGQVNSPRAWRSIQAELSATSSAGWRFAALVRAEAWLQASPDAVAAAALEAMKAEPEIARNYNLTARSQTWQGQGIRLGTPWLKLDEAKRWHWQADAQLLRLQRFRLIDLSGNVTYQGGNVYDFNLQSQRSNPGITGPFLPPSSSSGLGSSLSVALQGEPATGWRVQLRADDLLSRLQWSELATDTAVLNSQVISRAPDGSLNYAPLVKGKKALLPIKSRIGVHWQAKGSWSAFESKGQPGAITLRANRKADINQYWLGWDSGDAGKSSPRWSLEIEPRLRVASLALVWGGWHASLATDSKGTGSEFRSWRAGWQYAF